MNDHLRQSQKHHENITRTAERAAAALEAVAGRLDDAPAHVIKYMIAEVTRQRPHLREIAHQLRQYTNARRCVSLAARAENVPAAWLKTQAAYGLRIQAARAGARGHAVTRARAVDYTTQAVEALREIATSDAGTPGHQLEGRRKSAAVAVELTIYYLEVDTGISPAKALRTLDRRIAEVDESDDGTRDYHLFHRPAAPRTAEEVAAG